MQVLHVYILNEAGSIERSYDFLHNDGKDNFEGVDVVVPFDKDHSYPITETAAVAIINNTYLRRDH